MSVAIPGPGLEDVARQAESWSPHETLAWALGRFHPRIAFASSFGVEDVAVIHLLRQVRPDARVFTLDTGRLPAETYDVMERVRDAYGTPIEVYAPQREAVEALERERGFFSFRNSIDERKHCCGVRKVEPLRRALGTVDAWITGLRREQAVTRAALPVVEWDATHGIVKVNPIAAWSEQEVWAYVREHRIPYNALHDSGYPSIGCAPCTRAIQPGEDVRAGRWWWENPETKECGLHVGKANGAASLAPTRHAAPPE
jgi:phosphoadenosine phosphosulfate reductase